MAKHASTNHGPLAFGSHVHGPPGARPPARPDVPLWIARCALACCLVLLAARGALLEWAAQYPALQADGFSIARAGADLVRVALLPPAITVLRTGALVGLGLLAGELALAAVLLVGQTVRLRRAGHTHLRIRLPLQSTGSCAAPAGKDTARALHELLPAVGELCGAAPWIALTLSGRPDEPTELGAAIGGGTPEQQSAWVAAVRKIIRGHAPAAVVDEQPNPLAAVLRAGMVVLWREYALANPPSYPLRMPDDAATDLLGPLAAAHQPRTGVVYLESQAIVRPRRDWHMAAGWRVYATRRLVRLRARHEYALPPDVQALQEKLNGPTYNTTIRHIAVVQSAAQIGAGRAALEALAAVQGQYAARSGDRLQRLRVVGSGAVTVPAPVPERRGVRGPALAWASGLAVAAVVALLVHSSGTTSFAALSGWWPLLPVWPAAQALAVRLLPTMLALAAGLCVAWQAHQWQGALAETRVQRLVARAPRAVPAPPLLLPCCAWWSPAILSASEIGGLWHLPTPALGALVRWLPCRQLAPLPGAFVAAEQTVDRVSDVTGKETRLIVGTAFHGDGREAPVGPSLFDLRYVLHLTAGMGAGKTRLLANLCRQLIPNGFLLLDGKGDDQQGSLVATVRHHIPLEDEARLIILDPLDTAWPIGLNPMAGIDLSIPGGLDQALGQLMAIFARLDPETWSKAPGMQQFARHATLLVLEGEQHPTLAHARQALIDEHYRAALLPRCNNVEVRSFWETTHPQTGETQRTSRDALIRRFDALLTAETTRYLVTQALPTLDLLDCIEQGAIVLAPIPDLTLGDIAGAVGMLLLQAVVRAAMQRPGNDQTRSTYPLIVDELQVILGAGDAKDMQTAITRLRGLGIGGVYAHQSLAQLGDLMSEMLINSGSRIILQTQEPDASVYARQYAASGLTPADISGQDPGEHQYAVLRCAGVPIGPFSMRPLPWPAPPDVRVPPYRGGPWQDQIPPNSPTPAFDRQILRLVYGRHPAPTRVVEALADAPEAQWKGLNERWDAIRAYQRRYILDHPGCIADRLERQRWLSRLKAARPRILAAAEYARIRRAIGDRAAG